MPNKDLKKIDEYHRLEWDKKNYYDLINGSLNKISVAETDEERYKQVCNVMDYTLKYANLSIKSHKLIKELYGE